MFTPRRPQLDQPTPIPGAGSHWACGLAGALLLGMVVCLPAGAAPPATPPGQAASQVAAANGQTAPDTAQVIRVNITAAQAARVARNEYGGKVLGVRLEANDKAPYYRVKLLSGGRVQVVHVTAHE